jgi:hypothetical protein
LVPGFIGSDFRRGVAQDERGDPFGAQTIKFLRDHAADGKPDDGSPPDPDTIQKADEVARVVRHLALIRAGFGQAMAALVVSDDAEIGREDPSDLGPDAQVAAERVDEDDGRPIAPPVVEIVDDEAVGLHEFHGAGF